MTKRKATAKDDGGKARLRAVFDLNRALSRALELADMGPDFEDAARAIVGAVGAGVLHKYPDHTIALSKRLTAERRRAEWARRCKWSWSHLKDIRAQEADLRRRLVLALCEGLPSIDDRAGKLTPEHVTTAVDASKTAMDFAARLACECNAFGYAKDGNTAAARRVAKKGFANALRVRP